ncbi:hypothetical protein LOSG293_110550 [Secundilactobacillus oryzae JCM 18671]|uniref:Uncharacterized protein n=1 Tax=Secundilactobacillus oryzae JCM 18671 TaxID=1291743 RepID=A0A081BI71_9LACO|nr:hypothetical protein [Secundilactobacillus oryzae]GAK47739.1 hypothetical protein LOSG293_110550 [Secundilactobacillus oryzae JCM 18671]
MNPDYYQQNGKDLFSRFEDGLLTEDEYRAKRRADATGNGENTRQRRYSD